MRESIGPLIVLRSRASERKCAERFFVSILTNVPLFWTGMLGIALGAVCFIGMAFHGVIVEPEGNLYKAASFDIAVGLFALTLALIRQIAGFSPRGLRRFRRTLIGLTLFGYGVETIQIFRGYDPRFSRVSSPLDQAIGGIFFLSALGILVCFLVLMMRFFFRPTTGEGGVLVLALRYGTAASLLGFASRHHDFRLRRSPRRRDRKSSRRSTPRDSTDFRLCLWSRFSSAGRGFPTGNPGGRSISPESRGSLSVSAIAWQTSAGRSVLEPSAAMVFAFAVLLAWAFILSKAFLSFRRSGARLDFLAA